MSGDMEFMWQAMKGTHYKRIMNQLAKTVHETDDFQKVVSATLGTVIKAMRAETGTIWLYERFGSGRIHPKSVYGGADLSGTSLAPGEGIAGEVVESGKPVIIEDCQKDSRWASRVDSKTGFRTRTMICVPLSCMGQTFGCIQIINHLNDMLFDDKDLSLAESLAKEVSALLQEKGMLRDYVSQTASQNGSAGVSFQSIFCQGSDGDLERRLRGIKEFVTLSAREQREVLSLCRQLRRYFE